MSQRNSSRAAVAAGALLVALLACNRALESPTAPAAVPTPATPASSPAAPSPGDPGPGGRGTDSPTRHIEDATGRGKARVTLCHVTGNGTYRLIEVSVAAEPEHRGHGDAAPGEPVPGRTGFLFAADCTLVAEHPAIDLEKATAGEDADSPPGPTLEPGTPVTWTYVVANTGDVPLHDVAVSDDQGVAVACPDDELAVGASMNCTASGVVAEGQYRNVGTATGVGLAGTPVSDSDPSHYFGRPRTEEPAIDIEKATNGEDADAPPGPEIAAGAAVTWTYVVRNTGDVTLSQITVTDDQGVAVSCPQTSLAPGAVMTCIATGVAVSGQYRNVGSVEGTSPAGLDVTDSDPSHYHNDAPVPPAAIDIEKATDGQDADSAPGPSLAEGAVVTWTYTVRNSGGTTLTDVTVEDDQGVDVSCPKRTLEPGEAMVCSAEGRVRGGQYRNVGTARGLDPDGAAVQDSDPSHYLGVASELPAIRIDKTTNNHEEDSDEGLTLQVGAAITWRYVVTNTGNVSLSSVSVTDDRSVAVSCPQTTLAAGEEMTCTGSGTAVAGPYVNVGTARGTSPGGTQVTASDSSSYTGVP